MTPATRDRVLIAAWLAWAVFVLSHYYRQAFSAAAVLRSDPRAAIVGTAGPLVLMAGIVVTIRVLVALGHRGVGRRMSGATVFLALGLMTIPWFLARDHVATWLAGVTVPGFPWLGEAAARASIALVGASLVAVAALGAGALVLRLIGWSTTSRVEQIVFAGVTGVPVVSFTSLLLAVFGLYRPLPTAVAIAALGIAGGLGAGGPGVGGARTRTEDRDGGLSSVPVPDSRPPSAMTGPWVVIAAAALAFGLVATLAPETEYDALWYHLQLPRLWLEAGHPVDLVQEYVSLYPLTWELVFGAA